MTKQTKQTPRPRVHKDLDGFDIAIDSFGEIKSNMNIERINEFLNRNVEDKKLVERDDYTSPASERRKKQLQH